MTNSVPLDSNYCAIAFLGDVSGSMSSFDTKELAESVSTIIKENTEECEVVFYGATFSDKFSIFADGVDGITVNITEEDLKPNGLTALIPSIGRMIKHVGSRLAAMTDRRPGKVIFIIMSDGEQTVNRLRNRIVEDEPYEGKTGKNKLKELIDEHQNIWKWSFMFMGTNFDSISTGQQFGLSAKQCINFASSDGGIKNVMRCVSSNINSVQRKAKSRLDKFAMTGIDDGEDDLEGFTPSQRTESMAPTNLAASGYHIGVNTVSGSIPQRT
jgi:hypothetical protein